VVKYLEGENEKQTKDRQEKLEKKVAPPPLEEVEVVEEEEVSEERVSADVSFFFFFFFFLVDNHYLPPLSLSKQNLDAEFQKKQEKKLEAQKKKQLEMEKNLLTARPPPTPVEEVKKPAAVTKKKKGKGGAADSTTTPSPSSSSAGERSSPPADGGIAKAKQDDRERTSSGDSRSSPVKSPSPRPSGPVRDPSPPQSVTTPVSQETGDAGRIDPEVEDLAQRSQSLESSPGTQPLSSPTPEPVEDDHHQQGQEESPFLSHDSPQPTTEPDQSPLSSPALASADEALSASAVPPTVDENFILCLLEMGFVESQIRYALSQTRNTQEILMILTFLVRQRIESQVSAAPATPPVPAASPYTPVPMGAAAATPGHYYQAPIRYGGVATQPPQQQLQQQWQQAYYTGHQQQAAMAAMPVTGTYMYQPPPASLALPAGAAAPYHSSYPVTASMPPASAASIRPRPYRPPQSYAAMPVTQPLGYTQQPGGHGSVAQPNRPPSAAAYRSQDTSRLQGWLGGQ